jgi:vacuolar protein sorting-associated protein 13A/C
VENIERNEQKGKQKKLAEAELLKQAKSDTPSDSDTFASRLVTKIIDNVQVEISDVHIRYEDDITNPKVLPLKT